MFFSFLHDLRRSTTGDLRQGRIDSVRTRTSRLSCCSLPFHRPRVSGSLCSFTWSSSWNHHVPLIFRHLLPGPRQVLFVKLIIQYLVAFLLYAIVDDLGKQYTTLHVLFTYWDVVDFLEVEIVLHISSMYLALKMCPNHLSPNRFCWSWSLGRLEFCSEWKTRRLFLLQDFETLLTLTTT